MRFSKQLFSVINAIKRLVSMMNEVSSTKYHLNFLFSFGSGLFDIVMTEEMVLNVCFSELIVLGFPRCV